MSMHKQVTKRMTLSDLNKIFDPLRFLSPVLIRGKIFLQQMWAKKMNWDSQISLEMQDKWIEFYNSLERLKDYIIPRRVKPSATNEVEMYGFCDASEVAYGACIYVRSKDNSGKWHSRLLCAKTRVVPLKGATVPRLELSVDLLLAELVHKVSESWSVEARKFRLWTDSMIVLTWLNSQKVRLKTYVLNRISQVLELTEVNQWNHVRINENPVDVISRGICPAELLANNTWWYGPKWMSSEEVERSPSVMRLVDDELIPEHRPMKLALASHIQSCSFLNAYSDWEKLVRSIAWLLWFLGYKTNKPIENSTYLTVPELKRASLAILKRVQAESFFEEKVMLEGNKELLRRSKIKNLCPFINDGLIRVGGRLEYAEISLQRKHPILLPASHRITRLIFEDKHRELLHCGPQSLLAEVRRQYWPLKGRLIARSVTSHCVSCIRAKPKFVQPLMAPLPQDRVLCSRPFTVTGVDFAGPLIIRIGVRRLSGKKAWIAVFVCFSTKAIHLEAVEDLTSSAFIASLRRFMSRRGKCAKMYSDNGTNFVGAQKELKSVLDSVDSTMAKEGVEWHFNPPSAPHFGGLWESSVKSMKFHLTQMMKDARLTLGELNTLLCQIEACVNSRPMTHLSSDPSDMEPLTPAHFLIGSPIFLIPEADLAEKSQNVFHRWKYVQYLMQTFWKRWKDEYLPQCQVRGKWFMKSRSLEVGDVVIIKEECTQPTKWKLVKVIKLHPGKDNVVRVVTLRLANGTEIQRPTVKLCRLPVQDDEDQCVKNQEF